MIDLRTALAAVLGAGIGLFLLVYPETVIRAQTAGRLPEDRGGEYGAERTIPTRWRRLVQALGLGSLLLAGYFASRLVA